MRRDKTIVNAIFHLKASEGTPQQLNYSTADEVINTIDATNAERIELKDGTVYESHFIAVPVLAKDYLSRSKADYAAENMFQGLAFVERIIDGNIALYRFVDRYGFSHFFYKRSADTTIMLLRNQSYVEQGTIEYDQAYKNQVLFLRQKVCTSNSPNVDRLDYSLQPMMKTFAALNACTGSVTNTSTFLEKQKATVNPGLLGGILSTALGLKTYHRSLNPTLGAFLDITPGKGYKNYKVSIEAGYQRFDQKEDSLIYPISHSQARAKFSVLNLNLLARFYVNPRQQRLFVEVGPNFNCAFEHTVTTETKDVVLNTVKTSRSEGGSLFYYGLTGGVGYDLQRLSLQARFGLMMHQNDDWIKNYFGLLAKVRLTNK